MPRYYPPDQIPISKVLEISRKLRVLADSIEQSSQGIAQTDFKEPWIFYSSSAEKAIVQLHGYSAALYGQLTKMKAGDPGAPAPDEEPELTEKAKKIIKKAKAGPQKKPKKALRKGLFHAHDL